MVTQSAQLMDFDSLGRVAGSFTVELKSSAEMRAAVDAGVKGNVLPDLAPANRDELGALADALAAQSNARVTSVTFTTSRVKFGIAGASEPLMRSEVATDPRVRSIAATIGTVPPPD